VEHKHVVCADVNLLDKNINTITKNMETLLNTGEEVGLEVNMEKTKYMFVLSPL
jgi:hypothetical protein